MGADTTDIRYPDVVCTGLSFIDVVFAGLGSTGPVLGTEIWTPHWGFGPGGVANHALGVARLGGLATIVTQVGDDDLGQLFVRMCAEEGIDTSRCVVDAGWRQPITAAMTWNGDRGMVTGGVAPTSTLADECIAAVREAPAAIVQLDPTTDWIAQAAQSDARVVAQVGWDETDAWDLSALAGLEHCWALMPNADEALHYTRKTDVVDAAQALAGHVPVVVVTRGEDGCVAVTPDEVIELPSMPTTVVDATGAGDMFAAAFTYAVARDCSVLAALQLATAVAGLGVAAPGGASAAPALAAALEAMQATPHLGSGAEEISSRLSNESRNASTQSTKPNHTQGAK